MAAEGSTQSKVQSVPGHLCAEILARVGRDTPIDYVNTLCSCKDMLGSADMEVFCSLNLAPLVKKPLLSIKYPKLMQKCLANSNLEANYVKGIVTYFHENNATDGMQNFKIAAEGGHTDSIYLYGILLLCNDHIDDGKPYLGKLNMVDNTDAADALWKKIKKSLHGIRVEKKHEYFTSMVKMEPGEECHIIDLGITCEKCFHFKQTVKFVFMM